MTKSEAIIFIKQHATDAAKVLSEPSLVRRIRSASSDSSRANLLARWGFLDTTKLPSSPPAQTAVVASPKKEAPKKVPTKLVRKRRKKSLDNT